MVESLSSYLANHRLESIGALTGIISIYLNTRENPLGWPLGLVSVFCYLYVFWEVFLFGDVLLHIVYLVMGVYGWYRWIVGDKKTKSKNTEIEGSSKALSISHISINQLLIGMAIGTASTLIMGFLFQTYTANTLPYADAFTTSFSLVGTYLLANKYIENWHIWLVVNTVCVIIYYLKGLNITTGLYIVYWVLAIIGYLNWKKNMKQQIEVGA